MSTLRSFSSRKQYLDENDMLNLTVKKSLGPLQDYLKNRMYWNSECELTPVECRSRDGFIPYSDNCGGYELHAVIPYCEHGDDSVLDEYCFNAEGDLLDDFDCDGNYDKGLYIIFKYEGVNEKNEHVFYVNCSYGNGDAPYFRTKHLPTIFENEIKGKSISVIKNKLDKTIKVMIETLKTEF